MKAHTDPGDIGGKAVISGLVSLKEMNQGGYIGFSKMEQGISSRGVDNEDTMTEDLANLRATP